MCYCCGKWTDSYFGTNKTTVSTHVLHFKSISCVFEFYDLI